MKHKLFALFIKDDQLKVVAEENMTLLLDWTSHLLTGVVVAGLLLLAIGLIAQYIVIKYYFARNTLREPMADSPAGNSTTSSKPKIDALYCALRNFVEGWIRTSLLFIGHLPSHGLRKLLYTTIYKMKIHNNAVIYGGSEIRSPFNIEIKDGAIIGDNSILDGRYGIVIGKNANLSTGVWIWTLQHNPQSPDFSCSGGAGQVIIGDRAWISCRVVILPGVTIGEGAVVAAGSVVTKSLDPFTINAGIPAKKIGDRNPALRYEFDGSHLYFY